MISDRDVIRIVETWLEEEVSVIPDRVLDAVLDRVPATPQRRAGWLARRLPIMNNNTFRFGIAAVAVVLIAIVGYQLWPGRESGAPQVSPSPTTVPSPSSVPSPSATLGGFPSADIPAGQYRILKNQVYFTITVSSDRWRRWDRAYSDIIETGTAPNPGEAWVILLTRLDRVSVDPCTGTSTLVGSVDEAVTAMTAIAGMDAQAPIDTTVGGLPAKLVTMTVRAGFPCGQESFWLYGSDSYYPSSPDSIINDWVFELDGTLFFLHADQIGSDAALTEEIKQMVDSIQFE